LSYDQQFVSAYLEETGLDLPEGVSRWDAGEWLESSEYAADYADWFSNVVPSLVDEGQISWNPPTAYSNARESSGWFIHFTPMRFVTFADGVDRKHLGNSRTQQGNRQIQCPANLTATPESALWVHAWPVFSEYGDGGLNEQMVRGGLQYGHNALLFRSDRTVVAQHAAHEEEHALVLGCSEYDAVQLLNLRRGWNEELDRETLSGTALLKDGDAVFNALEDLVHLLESSKRKSASSLSGARRGHRWHPLSRGGR
jgi:hypothetical protein